MNYKFKWELTTNCSYNCSFCRLHGYEKYTDMTHNDKIINFFSELAKEKDTESINVLLFGGECTIHPDFLEITKKISDIEKVNISIFTNLSSDIEIYDKFCCLYKDKLVDFMVTYHEEFSDSSIFIEKLKYLITTYNVRITLYCMVGKGRKTESEFLEIFKDLLKYNSLHILFAPILGEQSNENVKSDVKNTYRLINNKNPRYNKYCTNYYEIESFINSKGILFPCQMVQTYWNINILKSTNPVDTFNALKSIKIKCSKKHCCADMPKEKLYEKEA